MATEIERKFLVAGPFKAEAERSDRIVQGYLCSTPERTVRIRIRAGRGFLTIKGPSDIVGISRYEFEYEIPVDDAEALLPLCEPGVVEKIRYLVPFQGHIWEVDEFLGSNEGLVLAELELKSETEFFEKPAWLGEEVTGQIAYYNAMLSQRPYRTWKIT